MREQCVAGVADWYVEGASGRTFCPDTVAGRECTDCKDRGDFPTGHDRRYGTETNELSMFFAGEEPTREEIKALITDPDDPGWFLIEFRARATSHGVYGHLWTPAEEDA